MKDFIAEEETLSIFNYYNINRKNTMIAILQDIKCGLNAKQFNCNIFWRSWESLTNQWMFYTRL